MKPQHRLAAFGLAAGLLGGGAAGMALGLPGFAGAQTGSPSTTASADPADSDRPAKRQRGAWMRDALAPLVEKGTISQAQADAVITALENARPAKGPGRHRGHKGARIFGARLEAAAAAIGVTADEVHTALRDGQSLADVARSKDVDPEKVVSAIAGEVKARLDQSVSAGRLTRAEADEKLAMVTELIRAVVNGEAPHKGRFGVGPGRHGPRGPRPDAAPGAPSNATPSSFSTVDA